MDEVATVGIFVFNNRYRGMGLGKVLVWAATSLFHHCMKTEWFGAGMEKENIKSPLKEGYFQVFDVDITDFSNVELIINKPT